MKKWIAGVLRLLSTFRFYFTLREGERVCGSPHPPRSGPPSPRGEGQYAVQWARLAMAGAHGYRRTSSTASGPPSPLRGRYKRGLRGSWLRMSGASEPGNAALDGLWKCIARQGKSRPLSGVLIPSPMRGRGTTLVVDEVKTAPAVAPRGEGGPLRGG